MLSIEGAEKYYSTHMAKRENIRPDLIITNYVDYEPDINATKIVQSMIAHVNPEYLNGLNMILLTNASGMSHDRKRAKTWAGNKKVKINACYGLYHPKSRDSLPWIEIFVDNIFGYWPKVMFYFPTKYSIIGNVLFHELGHHIHKHVRPQYKGRELAAEQWKDKLLSGFLRKSYWYLLPFYGLLYFVFHSRKKESDTDK